MGSVGIKHYRIRVRTEDAEFVGALHPYVAEEVEILHEALQSILPDRPGSGGLSLVCEGGYTVYIPQYVLQRSIVWLEVQDD